MKRFIFVLCFAIGAVSNALAVSEFRIKDSIFGATREVPETGSAIEIVVERLGNLSEEATVFYFTNNEFVPFPAEEGDAGFDYFHTEGTLIWLAGEGGEKSFQIHRWDDTRPEGPDQFQVYLSDNESFFIGGRGIDILPNNPLTISLIDNDELLGDLNNDGCFDSTDLLIGFQQGPLAFDNDGDDEYTDDLALAFQQGVYEKKPNCIWE